MKRLRVATGLHLEAAQIQWMEQSKVESIKERMFSLVLEKGIPFWGSNFTCPRENLFDSSDLISGNSGTTVRNALSGQCDWLKVIPGKKPKTIRILPGVAYNKFGERITVPEISEDINIPNGHGYVKLQYATKKSGESDWWPGTPDDPNNILYKTTDYYSVIVDTHPPGDSEVKIAETEISGDTLEIIDKRNEAIMKLRFHKVPFHRHYKAEVIDFDHTHEIKKEQYSNIYQPFWDTAYKMPSGYWYIFQGQGQNISFSFYFYGTKWFKGASFWAKWSATFDNASFPYIFHYALRIYPPGEDNPIINLLNNEITFQSSSDEPETVVDIDPYDAASFSEGWWRVEIIGNNYAPNMIECWSSQHAFAVKRSYADSPYIYDENGNPI